MKTSERDRTAIFLLLARPSFSKPNVAGVFHHTFPAVSCTALCLPVFLGAEDRNLSKHSDCQMWHRQAGIRWEATFDVMCWANFPSNPSPSYSLLPPTYPHTPKDSPEAEVTQGFQNSSPQEETLWKMFLMSGSSPDMLLTCY